MMEPPPPTRLEDLPTDILGDILSRVGRSSRSQLRNVMEAAPFLTKAADDHRVFKKINLRPLALHPLTTKRRYADLMDRTLRHDNIEAHYVKGIVEYFNKKSITTGLYHLKAAAEGGYEDGMYLYGILKLCRGEIEEGSTYLDKLGWRQNKYRGDRCWKNVKKSLRCVRVRRKKIYMATLAAMEPTIMCGEINPDERCHQCYFYKQMAKFIFMI